MDAFERYQRLIFPNNAMSNVDGVIVSQVSDVGAAVGNLDRLGIPMVGIDSAVMPKLIVCDSIRYR